MGEAIATTAELRGAWVWPNIFRVHLAHIVVTTLPFVIPRNSTVYSTTLYHSYPKLDDTKG